MVNGIVFLWVATLAVMVAVTVYRGVPAYHLILWKYPVSGSGYYATLVFKAAFLALVGLHFVTDAKLLGEPPLTWAVLLMLLFLWVGIFVRFRTPHVDNPTVSERVE